MSSDSDTTIHLHAELLPNIRQLTFYVSLPAGSYISQDGSTLKPEISLSESRRAVTVSVGGEMETMKLPARVSESSRSGLRFPERALSGHPTAMDGANRMEFSFRMQVDKDEVPGLTKDEFVDDFIPWTAADMSTSALVRCRECSAVILDPGEHTEGWTWKDLPSGNWAEMMDFWHCHKPDPHEGHDHKSIEDSNAVLKGYGAANQISASPGTVLVDVASFLVAEVDCNGLRKVHHICHNFESQNERLPHTENARTRVYVECEACGATIGTEDVTANGWRLFKTCIAVQQESTSIAQEAGSEPSNLETYPKETIVGAQLLEMIEREGVRRFVIHCGGNDGHLLWIFNPDIRYSSVSPNHSVTSQRAMKAFFQHISDVEKILEPEQGKPASMSLEELYLPRDTYQDIASTLNRSNEMLPASARSFREWKVGFLSRLDGKQA
ncbi:hypothetical protein DTO021C3_2023 [Paecilomyces variotii]|nr:hypothetical protein DTO195F2_3085 [Paecilomyces variotii]KAJ9290399.1 hypothetical protein DTO021C3_2023 [Paecilomyces variotii]